MSPRILRASAPLHTTDKLWLMRTTVRLDEALMERARQEAPRRSPRSLSRGFGLRCAVLSNTRSAIPYYSLNATPEVASCQGSI